MKLFGLILTYNCQPYLEKTITSIPTSIFHQIICSDDGSADKTREIAEKYKIDFFSHDHLGYGGNLLFGLEKAFSAGADYVVEIHGDGQYSLEFIDEVFDKINENYDLILGNRFYSFPKLLETHMPPHIIVGNLFFSLIGRLGIGLNQPDLFPGFRVYSSDFFNVIKNYSLPNGYQFSFEIIVLSKIHCLKIGSIRSYCDYKSDKQTAPLSYVISALLHVCKLIYKYRLLQIFKINLFKKIS
jgi:glycosyltransferase involved in cell wall biosynthesis